MTREEILNILKDIFEDVFDYNQEITEDTSKEDVDEWDSMTHVLLLSKVQKRFDVSFDMSNLIEYDTVGKIIDGVIKGKK